MPNKKYKVGSDVYDIPEADASNFLNDFPNAIELETFIVDKDTFDIPVNEIDGFLTDFPKAKSLKKKDVSEVSGTPSEISGVEPSPLTTEKPKEATPQSILQTYLQEPETGSYMGDILERIGAGAIDYAASGPKRARFAQKLLNIPKNIAKKELEILGFSGETAEKISKAIPFIKPKYISDAVNIATEVWDKIEKTDEFQDIENKAAELRQSSERYDQSFTELLKAKEYKKAIGAAFLGASESFPMTMAAAFGGPVALADLGMYSASAQYDNISPQSDMKEVEKIANALANGGLEIATERLGSANYGRLIKSLYKTAGKETAETAIKQGLKTWFVNMFKKFGIYTAPFGESLEEGINGIGGNITARITGEDPDRPILWDVGNKMGYGFAGGGPFVVMGVPAQIRQSFKPTKEDNVKPKPKEEVKEKKVTDMGYSLNGKEITREEAEQLIDEAKDINDLNELRFKDDRALESRMRDKFNIPTEEEVKEEPKIKEETEDAERKEEEDVSLIEEVVSE